MSQLSTGETPRPTVSLRLSALASLGLVASLWVAPTLKGRLRVSALKTISTGKMPVVPVGGGGLSLRRLHILPENPRGQAPGRTSFLSRFRHVLRRYPPRVRASPSSPPLPPRKNMSEWCGSGQIPLVDQEWWSDGRDAAVADGTISGRACHAPLPEHYILGLTTTIKPSTPGAS